MFCLTQLSKSQTHNIIVDQSALLNSLQRDKGSIRARYNSEVVTFARRLGTSCWAAARGIPPLIRELTDYMIKSRGIYSAISYYITKPNSHTTVTSHSSSSYYDTQFDDG